MGWLLASDKATLSHACATPFRLHSGVRTCVELSDVGEGDMLGEATAHPAEASFWGDES